MDEDDLKKTFERDYYTRPEQIKASLVTDDDDDNYALIIQL